MVTSRAHLIRCITFLTALIISAAIAQEPSPSLKQADAQYRAGVAALSRNDLATARADFEQVVRLAPQAEQGHSALGAVLVRLGQMSTGIQELEKALAIKATDSSAQMNLALAYEQIGESAKAVALFSKLDAAARAEKRSLPPYVLAAYARALVATHQLAAATAKMKAASAADPQNAQLHDDLGTLYAQRQEWPSAQQQFSEAIRLDPNLAAAHLHLGLTLQAQNQPDAFAEIERAYELAPQNAPIVLEYGRALAAAGKDDQAIPVFQHVLDLDPASITASYQLGLALQRTGKVQEAITLLRKAVTADPKSSEALTNLGMALCQAQQAKDAVPFLQKAVVLAPDNVTAHQNLAAAYVQLSQFADAISELHIALKLSPDAARLHYNLGLALKMQDDAADAIPELETAEKINPSAPEPPYVLGVLYMQAGRYEDAARELSASLKLRPQNGDGWATLGSVYSKLDKLPEAASALREAIRQLPEQPDPHLTLAAVLARQNQPAEAAEERKTAANLMRANMNRQRAEVATNAGKSLLEKGNIDDAIVQFRDALSYDPGYRDAHLGLASALDRQGKTADAADERRKAEAADKAASP
jgi:protein O-GlcNAc transferase